MNELTDVKGLMRQTLESNSDSFKGIAFDNYGDKVSGIVTRRAGSVIEWIESMGELHEDEDAVSTCLVFGIKHDEVQWCGCAKL